MLNTSFQHPAPALAAPSALFQTDALSVRYGSHVALDAASVHVAAGEFVALIGPNGAGKSTLLKALLGLLPVHGGAVRFAPDIAARPKDAIAYVPQQQTLDWSFPVTVWDVTMMGRTGRLGWLRWPGRADRDIVRAALEQTGVLDLRARPIADLSGGQKQRVLLARMLAREARLLLLDEPLTGVDAATGERVMALLQTQAREGKGVLMVTHDLESAARWCDRLILVNRRVIAQGTPEEVYTGHNVEATFSSSHLGPGHEGAD